jgi:hypothetical protein
MIRNAVSVNFLLADDSPGALSWDGKRYGVRVG